MMGTGHRIGAAAIVLGVGLGQLELARQTGWMDPLSPGEVAAAALLAVPFSAGQWSPDADNRGWLKATFGHRGAVHWWGWPVAVIAVLAVLGAPWWLHGPALGWGSHIVLDWIFGKGGPSIAKGVPRWPWRGSPRHGLGLRVTANRGVVERALIGSRRTHSVAEGLFTVVLALALVVEVGWLAGTVA